MTYQLKAGEYVKNGLLYGWTGKVCSLCNGHGEHPSQEFGRQPCKGCGGTGEWHGLMEVQPDDLPEDTQ